MELFQLSVFSSSLQNATATILNIYFILDFFCLANGSGRINMQWKAKKAKSEASKRRMEHGIPLESFFICLKSHFKVSLFSCTFIVRSCACACVCTCDRALIIARLHWVSQVETRVTVFRKIPAIECVWSNTKKMRYILSSWIQFGSIKSSQLSLIWLLDTYCVGRKFHLISNLSTQCASPIAPPTNRWCNAPIQRAQELGRKKHSDITNEWAHNMKVVIEFIEKNIQPSTQLELGPSSRMRLYFLRPVFFLSHSHAGNNSNLILFETLNQ